MVQFDTFFWNDTWDGRNGKIIEYLYELFNVFSADLPEEEGTVEGTQDWYVYMYIWMLSEYVACLCAHAHV